MDSPGNKPVAFLPSPTAAGVTINGNGITSPGKFQTFSNCLMFGTSLTLYCLSTGNSLQNGVTRLVTQGASAVHAPIGIHTTSTGVVTNQQNVIRTGLSGISNVLSTGGVTPGIRQATLGTLISGTGVTGANSISSLQGPAMTVNNSSGGATSTSTGQAGQNQTIVLSKGTVTMASPGTIGLSQNPPPPGPPTNHQGQPIAIGTGAGLQFVNMNNLNTVRATAVNVGAGGNPGGTHHIVAAGPAGGKNIGQRMIISPQMLNTRPGQPGVSFFLFILIKIQIDGWKRS